MIERPAPQWQVSRQPVAYPAAVAAMEARVAAIHARQDSELIWLLEHPPLYTAGTSAREADLLDARFPVHRSGRGGQFTYHGPGQRVVYVMMDLARVDRDLRRYVHLLEGWVAACLAQFGVEAGLRDGRVGLWVADPVVPGRDNKIAAVGIRVRRGISFHGVAINVCPDLSHFAGIVPCGVRDHGVTSLAALGRGATLEALDQALWDTRPDALR